MVVLLRTLLEIHVLACVGPRYNQRAPYHACVAASCPSVDNPTKHAQGCPLERIAAAPRGLLSGAHVTQKRRKAREYAMRNVLHVDMKPGRTKLCLVGVKGNQWLRA